MDETAAAPRRAALVFIFITVALDMLSLGMVLPVLPKLVESLVRRAGRQPDWQCPPVRPALPAPPGTARRLWPFVFTLTFSYFIRPGESWYLPGAPFLLASILLLASAMLAWRATRPRD